MQGRFSDSPYFMLRDFFNEINNTEYIEKDIISYNWEVEFISTFVDNGSASYQSGNWTFDNGDQNDVVFTNWSTNTFGIIYTYDPNFERTDGSYIVSPFVNITTHGNGIMNLFVKEPDEGYIPISVKYVNTDGDRFNFTSHNTGNTLKPGDTIVATLSGNYYRFDEYNTEIGHGFGNYFNNNRETYFRKDSLFHDWLRKYAHDYYKAKWNMDLDIRNYVNYDKIFLFFHKIFKSRNEIDCRIIFYGMKNFVMDAIPEHQRTPKFKEFMDIFFDELYQENYNQLKDVWELLDAMTTALEYLGYLSRFYDMFDVEKIEIEELRKREFVRDMIWILKRKGTYTDYFILWLILTDTRNRLNIYERWHTKNVSTWASWPNTIDPTNTSTWPNYPYYSDTHGATNVPENEWYDVIYTLKPEYHQLPISGGAGPFYYSNNIYPCTIETYDITGMILSTHYIIEIDINDEPMEFDKILSKATWDKISLYWEYLRPVNRVSDYRVVFAPKTDFSGDLVPLYSHTEGKVAYALSQSVYYYSIILGSYIHRQDAPSNSWNIIHNLDGPVHIQVFDEYHQEIIPSDIEFVSNNVINISLNYETTGFALIRIADRSQQQQPVNNIWNVINDLNNDKLIINFNDDEHKTYEGSLELIDNINSMATFSVLSNTRKNVISEGNLVYFQYTPSTEWDVVHYLGVNGLIANIYDMDNNRIMPSEYILDDPDKLKVVFDTPQDGYIILMKVGNFTLDGFEFGNATIKLFENEGDLNNGVSPIYESGVDFVVEEPDSYYIQKTIPINEEFVFREVGIYHENGNLLFYTKCSETYKPKEALFTVHYRVKKEF